MKKSQECDVILRAYIHKAKVEAKAQKIKETTSKNIAFFMCEWAISSLLIRKKNRLPLFF